MKKTIVALMFILFISNTAVAEISEVIDLVEWKKSTSYLLSSKMSGVKSDKFEDGVFDCEDWVGQYNEWVLSRRVSGIKEVGVVGLFYELKGKKYGHALSFYTFYADKKVFYLITDAENGLCAYCDSLAEVKQVCIGITALSHYYSEDVETLKSTIKDMYKDAKIEFHKEVK